MYCRIGLMLFIFTLLPNSAFSQPTNDEYYKSLALDAITATVVYYSLYAECLEINSLANEVCHEDGVARKPNHLNNVMAVRDAFLEKYKKIYLSKKLTIPSSIITLRIAREKFDREVVYFQRKLLIFMAKVEVDCGNPQNYGEIKARGRELMQYFTSDTLMSLNGLKNVNLDDPIFAQYEISIANTLYKDKLECGYYANRNKEILVNVYSDPYRSMRKNWPAEQTLGHFISVLMDDLVVGYQKDTKVK